MMLVAVEGGGFFSSSASGYSKGLTLLLLGQKNEDNSIRVSPWNHYQLVSRETDPELQLASTKSCLLHGCGSFGCFGCDFSGVDSPPPTKVGSIQHQDIFPELLVSDKVDNLNAHEDGHSFKKVVLKSSLKKPSNHAQISMPNADDYEAMGEKSTVIPCHTDSRKVLWTDACGSELVEIREFETSEIDGTENELEQTKGLCVCNYVMRLMSTPIMKDRNLHQVKYSSILL